MPSVVFSVLFAFVLVMQPALANTLNVQFSAEPTQYDPLFLEDGTALRLAANVIGTLYEYDGLGNLRKNLVSQISVSRDRKKYTIKFKKNLKWSDGVKFNADQFVAAINRLEKEPIKVALSDLFPEIDVSKTRAIDSLTAEVTLKSPDAQFTNWLTLPPFAPIRADMLDAFEKRNPVVPTLAAYAVTEYKREDYLLLKKNPEYDAKDSVRIDEVKIRFLKDEATLLPLLKSGGIDLLCKVPVLQTEKIRELAQITDVPVEAVTYLGLNTKKPPFNDVKNRRAFLAALDPKRAELAADLKTGEIPAQTFLPEILMPGAVRLPHEKASGDFQKFEFQAQTDSGSRNETILEFVQSELKSNFKWKMNLDVLDWKAHYAKLKSDPDEVYRFGWQNPVSDPYVTYQMLQTKSPNNFTGWSNPEYDRLVDSLRQETIFVKKAKLIARIEKIINDQVPVVPLLHQVLRFANSKRVLGFRANPFGVILFREFRLAKN